jgi:hypothetical protein
MTRNKLWQLRSAAFALDAPAARARHLNGFPQSARDQLTGSGWPSEKGRFTHSFSDVRACLRHYNISNNPFCAPIIENQSPLGGDDSVGTASEICRGPARAFTSDIG